MTLKSNANNLHVMHRTNNNVCFKIWLKTIKQQKFKKCKWVLKGGNIKISTDKYGCDELEMLPHPCTPPCLQLNLYQTWWFLSSKDPRCRWASSTSSFPHFWLIFCFLDALSSLICQARARKKNSWKVNKWERSNSWGEVVIFRTKMTSAYCWRSLCSWKKSYLIQEKAHWWGISARHNARTRMWTAAAAYQVN